jgi:hypothetical protein
MPTQIEFKIIQLNTGGFVVKNGLFDSVFASTRIDEALMYVRGKMVVFPLMARHENCSARSVPGALSC